MKKVISILLIAVMLIAGVFVLTGCGNNETTTGGSSENNISEQNNISSISQSNNNNNEDSQQSNISNNSNNWNDSKYAEYTNGLEEPNVKYTIKGVIMDQLTLNLEVTETELESYKQSLINAGFETYRDSETSWGMSNDTHNIQMNNYLNGIAYVYIGLK